jgi:ParB family chromosome partitioning protein
MTSGVFHSVALGDIVVNRDSRQRRELENIPVLADSIRRLGLIHPLVVTRDLQLVAGERRYCALAQLGWTSVPVQYVDELEPERLEAIELEENIKRQDISWQDQVMALRRYHKLRAANEPNWNMIKTGEAIGISDTHISYMLQIAEELARGNKMVTEAPKLSTAAGLVRRALERQDQQALDKIHEQIGGGPAQAPPPESILVEDFTEWVIGYTGPRFNFIHCDFPYGIEADTFNQGSASAHGGYTDTRETWEKLMMALEQATARATTQSCHLMFWFSMRKGDERLYEPTAQWLSTMGWDINPIPLIWMKSDGAGILPDPERGPRQIYESCFLGSRGDRKIVRAKSNAYAAPTVRERHMSEKPEPMLRHFFEMLIDQNTVLLDPTCGSGSALRAAESLGAKYVLGLEKSGEFAELAKDSLNRSRRLRRATSAA